MPLKMHIKRINNISNTNNLFNEDYDNFKNEFDPYILWLNDKNKVLKNNSLLEIVNNIFNILFKNIFNLKFLIFIIFFMNLYIYFFKSKKENSI
jgi:ABC-type multidrug transport system permease subunit